VNIRYRCEIAGGGGSGHLEQLLLRNRDSGVTELVTSRRLVHPDRRAFTGWLPEPGRAID
jgi:hypothetical protein